MMRKTKMEKDKLKKKAAWYSIYFNVSQFIRVGQAVTDGSLRDVEIRQTEARNSYLKKNLEMMKQALEDKIADEQTS